MKLAIALFVVGLLLFGAGLTVFEKYSPFNTTSPIMWQYWIGLVVMLVGVGLALTGYAQWLVARIKSLR